MLSFQSVCINKMTCHVAFENCMLCDTLKLIYEYITCIASVVEPKFATKKINTSDFLYLFSLWKALQQKNCTVKRYEILIVLSAFCCTVGSDKSGE